MASPVRSFGPILGPGTRVIEREGTPSVVLAPFGTAAFIGQFARGPVNSVSAPVLSDCASASQFARKMGGRMAGVVTPDVVQDYFSHGGVRAICVRVTDGTEEAASVVLYSRHWGVAKSIDPLYKGGQAQVRTPVLRVSAKNGGRWGGRKKVYAGKLAASGDLLNTTVTTGVTMLENEWVGATLTLLDVAGKSYLVLSNTAEGVLTLTTGSTAKSDYTTASGSTLRYTLTIANRALTTGGRESLAIAVVGASRDPANNFGLEVRVDNSVVKTYTDLSMDPTSADYVEAVVDAANAGGDNDEIAVTDLLALTGYEVTPWFRPSNAYAMPLSVSATQLSFPIAQVAAEGTSIKVVGIEKTSVDAIPHRLTFTWSASGNLYTVVASEVQNGYSIGSLPNFTMTGGGAEYAKTYDPGALPTVKVTVDHAAEPANGAQFVIDVLPLPADATGGSVYPDAVSSPFKRIAIATSTVDTVSINAGDLTVDGLAPTLPSVTSTNAQAYAPSTGSSDKLKIAIDGRDPVTVTLANTDTTAALVVAAINAAFDSQFGAGVLNPASETSDHKVKLASTHWEKGPGASIEIMTISNNAYTVLGLTVGTTRGVAGKAVLLSFPQQCSGGHDGGAPADAKFLEALDLEASPLRQCVALRLGEVQFCTPDKTSTDVQKAGTAFAEANWFFYTVQIPSTVVSEQAAVAYVDDTIGRSDYQACYWPSFAYVRDPDKNGALKLVSLTGAILGLDAKFANAAQSYIQPAAGVSSVLSRIVKLPTGFPTLPNMEITNPRGVNTILKKGGNYVVWGARTLSSGSTWQFKPQRLQMSHYEHTLLVNYDWVIFALNDESLWSQLRAQLTTFFVPEWQVKRVLKGTKQDAAFTIKIDSENNTPASMENGDLNVEITLSLTRIVERIIFSVGKRGVSETSA